MINIRNAELNEFKILTDIAIRSEAYWGYDSKYMKKFKDYYSITEDFIIKNSVVLIENDKDIIGFYGMTGVSETSSLEYFFIEPKYIGQGYGKLLWDYLIKECKFTGIKEICFVTSTQARDFYIKMGAIPCEEIESLLKKGRMIPKLIFNTMRSS